MTQLQYIRKVNLYVAGEGDGLDLSGLHITFSVSKKNAQTPNTAKIKIYNLAEETIKQIRKEFTRVVLQAGYESNFGVIFDGNIIHSKRGRENNTDTYLELIAGDGDLAYTQAIVNTTLAAGATQNDQVRVAGESMKSKGVTTGHIDALPSQKLPRGKVMYGMSRDYLRKTSQSSDTTWSIQDGKLQVIKNDGVLPNQAILLTSKTGLIGTPELNNEGVKARCLLNPLLRIGGKVKIDESSIAEAALPDTSKNSQANKPPPLDADGIYKVLTLDYTGDTHGNDWYCDFVCLGVNKTSRR